MQLSKENLAAVIDIKEDIKKVGEALLDQLNKTEKVLLRGLLEATEVNVPTCFTILSEKGRCSLQYYPSKSQYHHERLLR